MSEALFNQYADRLINRHSFGVFAELAAGDLDPQLHVDRASTLEDLLDRTITALREKTPVEPEVIVEAVSSYVTDIWPLRTAAGLDHGIAAELAEEAGVMNRLPSGILSKLRAASGAPVRARKTLNVVVPQQRTRKVVRDQSPAAAAVPQDDVTPPADAAEPQDEEQNEAVVAPQIADAAPPPPPPAPPPPLPPPPQPRMAPSSPFVEPEVTYEQIRERIFRAKKQRHKIIIVLGLATAGKTFFVRRLGDTLSGHYTLHDISGRGSNFGTKTDRTKDIVYYFLERTARNIFTRWKWPRIHLFDLPGEFFRDLAMAGDDSTLDDDKRRGLSAILSAADLCVIIEPAMHVLQPEIYCRDGDCSTDLQYADFLEEAADEKRQAPATYPETAEFYARRKANEYRVEQTAMVKAFHHNFNTVRGRMVNLRAITAPALRGDNAEQFDTLINEYLATPFAQLAEADDPLPIPGLLLFSRTDDYALRAANGNSDFASDPAHRLAESARDKYRVYERAFAIFGVDFITAYRPDGAIGADARDYHDDADNAGVKDIIHSWILPAIRSSRSRNPVTRWLRGPGRAIGLRGWFDREFKKAWNRT